MQLYSPDGDGADDVGEGGADRLVLQRSRVCCHGGKAGGVEIEEGLLHRSSAEEDEQVGVQGGGEGAQDALPLKVPVPDG